MQTMILIMGWFLIAVAILKILDWKGFVHAFSQYDLIAKNIPFYGALYPLIEFSIGMSFVNGWYVTEMAVALLIIMIIGAIGVIQNVLSPKRVHCACLGTLIPIPLTWFTVFEDITMAVMASIILFF